MKIVATSKGKGKTLSITRDEWLRVGEKQGWMKQASYSPPTERKVVRLSEQLNKIMKTASEGDLVTLSSVSHIMIVNTGQDTGVEGFAGILQSALSRNPAIKTPRIVELNVSGAIRKASGNLGISSSALQILSSSDTIWNVRNPVSVTTDVIKMLQANSKNFVRNNVWVVLEATD